MAERAGSVPPRSIEMANETPQSTSVPQSEDRLVQLEAIVAAMKEQGFKEKGERKVYSRGETHVQLVRGRKGLHLSVAPPSPPDQFYPSGLPGHSPIALWGRGHCHNLIWKHHAPSLDEFVSKLIRYMGK